MKKAYLLQMAFVACIGLATGCNTKPAGSSENVFSLTQFVDPKIGSGGHGHVFVGANVPFGFVQLGPTSVPQEWDWTSGYHVSDSTVIGFPHLHLSGTGIGDLHDITVMPVTGEVVYARGVTDDPQSGLWSYSDRSREQVRPGYYATHLTRYDIDVELTATKRVGFHRYTFPESEASGIVFDLQNGGGWDRATEASVRVIDDRTICGYRYSRGWANDQRVYFHAEFSRPFKAFRLIADGQPVQGASATASVLYGRADFETEPGDTILLKVALSPTGLGFPENSEGSRRSLEPRTGENRHHHPFGKRPAGVLHGFIPHNDCAFGVLRRRQHVLWSGQTDSSGRRVRQLYDVFAVGHIPRRASADDHHPSGKNGGHHQHDAPHS